MKVKGSIGEVMRGGVVALILLLEAVAANSEPTKQDELNPARQTMNHPPAYVAVKDEPPEVPQAAPPEWTGYVSNRRNIDDGQLPEWARHYGPTTWVSYPGAEHPPSLRRGERRTTPQRPANYQDAANYQNIRITPVFDKLDMSPSALGITIDDYQAKQDWLQNTLMPAATQYLSQLLKVIPVSGPLFVGRDCPSAFSYGCAQAASSTTCGSDYGTVADALLGSLDIYNNMQQVTSTLPAGTGTNNSDFIIFVTAKLSETCNSGGQTTSTLAYAGACEFDQYDRPVVGHVNFCPEHVSMDAAEYTEQWGTAVHEVMHSLGFSGGRFAWFWDSTTGQPRTARDAPNFWNPSGKPEQQWASGMWAGSRVPDNNTLASFEENGKTVWKIVTPNARNAARDHFGCTTLNGVEIEDGGGSGTAGSHWEQRIYNNEVMTGVSTKSQALTAMTLGYFQDTGWYIPDYTIAGSLLWGKNAGCAFATSKCLTPGTPPTNPTASTIYNVANTFCTDETTTKHCEHNNVGYGVCSIASYTSSLPSYYQYWSSDPTKGGNNKQSTMDYCPSVKAYSNYICTNSANTKTQNVYGETFKDNSRCFSSTLRDTGYVIADGGNNVGCYEFQCTSTKLQVKLACAQSVTSGCTPDWIDCPTTGGTLSVPGDIPASYGFASGSGITCPTYTSVCGVGYELYSRFGPAPQLTFNGFPSASTPTSTPTASSVPTPAPTPTPTNVTVPTPTPTPTPTNATVLTPTPTPTPTTGPSASPGPTTFSCAAIAEAFRTQECCSPDTIFVLPSTGTRRVAVNDRHSLVEKFAMLDTLFKKEQIGAQEYSIFREKLLESLL